MVWMIIVFGIVLVLCIIGFIASILNDEDEISFGLLIMGLASVGFLTWGICDTVFTYKTIDEHVADIVSIRRGGETDGTFFLGTGYVSSTQYYYYYYEAEPNRFKLGKVESEKSYIIQDNTHVPSIYKLKASGEDRYHYDIYVPENTIITTFVLD